MTKANNVTPITSAVDGNRPMRRMRTACQLHKELLKLDPETSVSLSYVRRMVARGILPYHQVGNRRLVDLDLFLAYVDGEYDPTGWEKTKMVNKNPCGRK